MRIDILGPLDVRTDAGDPIELSWRGPALTDAADSGAVQPAVARLNELRVSTLEDLTDAQLRDGNGPPDIPGLQAVVAEHPTRERAAYLLMHAGGRRRVVTAEIARLSGDCATARDQLHRATRLAADLRPDSEHHGSLATALGLVAAADGQIDAARERHRVALDLTSPSADPWFISRTLIGIADLAKTEHRPEAAAE